MPTELSIGYIESYLEPGTRMLLHVAQNTDKIDVLDYSSAKEVADEFRRLGFVEEALDIEAKLRLATSVYVKVNDIEEA